MELKSSSKYLRLRADDEQTGNYRFVRRISTDKRASGDQPIAGGKLTFTALKLTGSERKRIRRLGCGLRVDPSSASGWLLRSGQSGQLPRVVFDRLRHGAIVHGLSLAAPLDQPGMRQDFKMMRNRRRRDPAHGHNRAGVNFLISGDGLENQQPRFASLANALEILSILALSIRCVVTLRRPERTSVVAKT